MNAEIGAEAAQFPEKEYINGIAFAVCAQPRYVATIKSLFLVGLYKVWDMEGSTVGSLSDVLF